VARHTDDTVANLPVTGPAGGVGGRLSGTDRDAAWARGGLGGAPTDDDEGPDVDDEGPGVTDVTVEQVDLSADPFDDNLAAELAARQPRRLTSRSTLLLGGAVLIVGGFLGGVLVQKNFGTTTPNAANGAALGANARGGAGGFGGFGGGTGQNPGVGTTPAAGNSTTGTVKFVDGTTVYLTTADGQVITVKTSGSTTVRTQQAATLKDLLTGATVTVQGTADANGVITATQVTGQK
jgi:hypothetical protein